MDCLSFDTREVAGKHPFPESGCQVSAFPCHTHHLLFLASTVQTIPSHVTYYLWSVFEKHRLRHISVSTPQTKQIKYLIENIKESKLAVFLVIKVGHGKYHQITFKMFESCSELYLIGFNPNMPVVQKIIVCNHQGPVFPWGAAALAIVS